MKFTDIQEIDGKKLAKSEINLFAKLDKLGAKVGEKHEVRQNPYSRVSTTLCPVAVALHDFIVLQYRAGMVGKLFPVSVWDKARHTFLAYWPDQYYDLID